MQRARVCRVASSSSRMRASCVGDLLKGWAACRPPLYGVCWTMRLISEKRPQQSRCNVVHGLTYLLRGIGYVLSSTTAGAKTRRVLRARGAGRSVRCSIALLSLSSSSSSSSLSSLSSHKNFQLHVRYMIRLQTTNFTNPSLPPTELPPLPHTPMV